MIIEGETHWESLAVLQFPNHIALFIPGPKETNKYNGSLCSIYTTCYNKSVESAPVHMQTISAHPSVTSQDIPFPYKQQGKSTARSGFEDSFLHFSMRFKATLEMANALHSLKRNNQILNTDIYLQMFCWKVQLSAALMI